MNKAKIITVLFLFLASLLFTSSSVFAQIEPGCDDPGDMLGLECVEGYSGLSREDPRIILARIINIALGLLGIIATVLVIYAGFRWMTAGGNEESVKTAQKILTAAIIGLIIILSAFVISNFALREIYGAVSGNLYGAP